jgi:pyocin large subunit-like protein
MSLRFRHNLICVLSVSLFLLALSACRAPAVGTAVEAEKAPPTATRALRRPDIGFRTRRSLEEHYEKHGPEFGSLSQAEYLRQAQTLRDAPAGGDILEAQRPDGVCMRFERRTGAFLAVNEDFTIRTFFKPNDGERYFQRQLKRGGR